MPEDIDGVLIVHYCGRLTVLLDEAREFADAPHGLTLSAQALLRLQHVLGSISLHKALDIEHLY